MQQKRRPKKKAGFIKDVAKGSAKGLGRFASDAAAGVISELTSILSLGFYKGRRR